MQQHQNQYALKTGLFFQYKKETNILNLNIKETQCMFSINTIK